MEWILWGVAAFCAGDLPPKTQTTGDVKYEFTVEHDPLDDNYGHSELRVYKDGKREKDTKKINTGVKKEYRTKLAFRTRIVVRPLV